MSKLSIQSLIIPAADLGPENPLFPIDHKESSELLEYPADLPKEMMENLVRGKIASVYPYTFQDGFNRHLEAREIKAAVLENEFLRATFLLDYGGRLWSLVHKQSGKELLEVNQVIQLTNLALRNAWFSGGVEWNLGTTGHSPFTCSALFACRVEGADGMPILRFYEWERFRQTPFQIDAYLPDASQVLYVHTRITNPNDHSVPIYWWSNIAVPETSDTRVLVPAKSAYCLGCRPNYLERIDLPINNGVDLTYPKLVDGAADFFFDLETTSYPWIAALNREGQGLIQLSTHEMVGRKLWVWGSSPGGRNWQQFLSPQRKGYIEIQSGITRTQLEHKQLLPGASCSWLEGYGFMEADPAYVHGKDWTRAFQHVDKRVQNLVSPKVLFEQNQKGEMYKDLTPVEYYRKGSGWGALERRRREIISEKQLERFGYEFDDDSLSEFQEPWLILLETGAFPKVDAEIPFGSFVVDELWGDLIEKSLNELQMENWFAWYQAGISRYQAGNWVGAEEAWSRSIKLEWSPWAVRNLAMLAWRSGQTDRAATLFIEACKSAPGVLPLVIECGSCLGQVGRHKEWLQIVQGLPRSLQSNGRIRLMQAQSSLATGDLVGVEKFFNEGDIVADLREGECSISDLWIEHQVQKMLQVDNLEEDDPQVVLFRENPPVPPEIDFRMRI